MCGGSEMRGTATLSRGWSYLYTDNTHTHTVEHTRTHTQVQLYAMPQARKDWVMEETISDIYGWVSFIYVHTYIVNAG